MAPRPRIPEGFSGGQSDDKDGSMYPDFAAHLKARGRRLLTGLPGARRIC